MIDRKIYYRIERFKLSWSILSCDSSEKIYYRIERALRMPCHAVLSDTKIYYRIESDTRSDTRLDLSLIHLWRSIIELKVIPVLLWNTSSTTITKIYYRIERSSLEAWAISRSWKHRRSIIELKVVLLFRLLLFFSLLRRSIIELKAYLRATISIKSII